MSIVINYDGINETTAVDTDTGESLVVSANKVVVSESIEIVLENPEEVPGL